MGLTERRLEELGERAAREQDAALRAVRRPSTEERLAVIRGRSARARTRRLTPYRLGALIAAAACFLLAFVLLKRPFERDLSYAVDGHDAELDQWVGSDEGDAVLSFSDGSEVVVRAGARARVTSLEGDGAGILVERGSLRVRVVHRDQTKWVVKSGPFEVHVIGTEFEMGWDAAREELALVMTDGRVRIEGPCIEPSSRFVAAPERMRLACATPSTLKVSEAEPTSTGPPAAAPPVVENAEPATSSEPEASADPAASVAAAPAGPPAWRKLLGEGKPREAFEAMETASRASVPDGASGNELVELGSAARLAGKPQVAAKLYEAARSRFASSDAAAIAAYHMGRMAFDGRGAWSEAERWFGVYLAERPSGALAPEALGRSFEAAHRGGNAARARTLARRYLDAYADGAHAALAKKLLSESSDGAPSEGQGGGP